MSKTIKKTIVNCPTCGKPVEWKPEQHWRPFCSKRCRVIDLGDWADGSHRIPGEETLPDEQLTQDDGQES